MHPYHACQKRGLKRGFIERAPTLKLCSKAPTSLNSTYNPGCFKINSDDDDFDDGDDDDDGYSQLDQVDLTVLRLLSDRDLPNESTTLISGNNQDLFQP